MDNCQSKLGVGQRIGLSFISGAGLLSIVSVLIILALVIRNAVHQKRHPFRSHVDIYVASLFVSNIFEGVFATMNMGWAQTGVVACGTRCTIQGFLNLFGQTGVAMHTFTIAIHTFCVVFLRWEPSPSKLFPSCVVSFIWLYNLGFAIGYYIAHKIGTPKYVPTPFWCSLRGDLALARVFSQYLWLCLTIVTSITLYIILFFSLRGNIQVTQDGRWYLRKISIIRTSSPKRSGTPLERMEVPVASTLVRSVARKMLWYPSAYIIISLPAVVIRFSVLNKIDKAEPLEGVPFGYIALFYCLINGAGVINVALFTLTRPGILLFQDREWARGQEGHRSHPNHAFPLKVMTRSPHLSSEGYSEVGN